MSANQIQQQQYIAVAAAVAAAATTKKNNNREIQLLPHDLQKGRNDSMITSNISWLVLLHNATHACPLFPTSIH